MKTRSLILAVLFVMGLLTASLSTSTISAVKYDQNASWKKSDTTDNGGGFPVPPIGH